MDYEQLIVAYLADELDPQKLEVLLQSLAEDEAVVEMLEEFLRIWNSGSSGLPDFNPRKVAFPLKK